MPNVSRRAAQTIFSPIRKFAPLLQEAERQGVHIYKLNSGDPDIPPPPEFWRALRSYSSPNLGYAPSAGVSAHVAAWAAYYRQFGVVLSPENILPTAGCAEAILFALQAIADPGDEVVVFEPVYVSYRSFAAMTGVKLVPVRLPLEKKFALPPIRVIERCITPRTRGIVVVNPDNPTGKLWSPRELAALLALVKKRDLYLIADETYREIRFRGRPQTLLSARAFRQNVIVVDSASKRFSVPGARVGCVVSYNATVMRSALKFAQARLSVGTLEQVALTPLLTKSKAFTTSLAKEYRRRRDIVYGELSKVPGVVCTKPDGAFYLCARLPVDSAERFTEFLVRDFRYRNQTVLISPMQDFYISPGQGRNEIRIAYVLRPALLKKAMRLVRLGLAAYQKRE